MAGKRGPVEGGLSSVGSRYGRKRLQLYILPWLRLQAAGFRYAVPIIQQVGSCYTPSPSIGDDLQQYDVGP